MIGVPESGGGLERWIKIAVMSSICHDYVVCSNSWQFRPCILSLLSAHSISMRFAQIATRARLYRHVGHRSQEFNLFRLQLFFATTVAWSSCVTCVERLQCWQRSAPRPSALQALLPPTSSSVSCISHPCFEEPRVEEKSLFSYTGYYWYSSKASKA